MIFTCFLLLFCTNGYLAKLIKVVKIKGRNLMSLKQFIIVMLIATLVCWGAFIMVVFNVDPDVSGATGFILFYLTLLLALTGTISLIGLFVRRAIDRKQLVVRQVALSFRQAISFSILIIALIYLQSQRLLTWWNLLLLMAALTVLEFFLISYKKRR